MGAPGPLLTPHIPTHLSHHCEGVPTPFSIVASHTTPHHRIAYPPTHAHTTCDAPRHDAIRHHAWPADFPTTRLRPDDDTDITDDTPPTFFRMPSTPCPAKGPGDSPRPNPDFPSNDDNDPTLISHPPPTLRNGGGRGSLRPKGP